MSRRSFGDGEATAEEDKVRELVWSGPTGMITYYYLEMSINHSSSVSTVTPSLLASASFEPAPGPATT